ncbi:MAG: SGNH/GDSL hydrolase family protein [Clostridiales bacterium]|nr:SGNH/GDSL hydrolase family protein [Clostridiales bacterium]
MCYSKSKVFLAIFMSIIMVLSSTAFAGTKQKITYTALGDSIAFGTGATDFVGYTDLFSEHLTRKFGEVTYINLAEDGEKSEDLLMDLIFSTDLQYDVAASDVITISIGGNDLLGPFLDAFKELIAQNYMIDEFTVNYLKLFSDLAEWEMDPTTHPQFNGMLQGLSENMDNYISDFANNWGQIIFLIRTLNSEADIYVNTVFNPLKFSPNLYEYVDPAIQGLNWAIYSLADSSNYDFDYKVVDVYSNFKEYENPNKLIVGDLSSLASYFEQNYSAPVSLHPTDLGYKFILNMHKDLMD